MAQIRVRVLDNNTLELMEDGKAKDTIDLRSLQEIDVSPILKRIEEGKDEVYQNKLQQALNEAKNKYEEDVRNLNMVQASKLSEKELEVKDRYLQEINRLNSIIQSKEAESKASLEKLRNDNELLVNNLRNDISNKNNELSKINDQLKNEKRLELEALKAQLNSEYAKEIAELKTKLDNKELESQNKVISAVLAKEKEVREELTIKLENKAKELEMKNEELSKTQDALNLLRNQKASTNIKNIGEELETYCNNKVEEIMQNGWYNCSWTKDNKVVKNDGDVKGSKADYIFRVFADDTKDFEEELASVCLDMKDENPNSTNKKKNSDYFKALDDNRKKKNCRYAVLVSNLEMDHGTVLPIIKASEYEDMYVVRPGYLITFLNMIISLTTRFKELVLNKEREELEIKDKKDLLEEFDKIKNTYLDKPLEQMQKQIDDIVKSTESISTANLKIQEACEKIRSSYINNITSKIENFELKFNREYKKFEKKQD